MPVYRFFCPVCEAYFEKRLSFQSDQRAVVCPNGHKGVRRVFTPPTIIFKGSGFYVTDHPKQAHSGK